MNKFSKTDKCHQTNKLMTCNEKLFKQNSIASCIILLLFFTSFNAIAQTPITLEKSFDVALANNAVLKNEKLRTEYQQKLIKSSVNIPATNILGEYGQINSSYSDIRLGLSQNISFPKVYKRQKELLTEEWKSSVLNLGIQELKLKRLIGQVFYSLLYLQEKRELLQKTDSLFVEFQEKSSLRFKAGESNILEKTTADNQRGQIALQLSQLEQDIEIIQLQFQLLLNSETSFIPIKNNNSGFSISVIDSLRSVSHPEIQYWNQQQQIANAVTNLEKSKLSPDFTFGYNLMGMRGMGSDDKIYNSSPRFHSIQIGLGIPIFNAAQKAKIIAAKTNESITANDFQIKQKDFETGYKSALMQYEKFEKAVKYLEDSSINKAAIFTSAAKQQFLSGEINYLEWVLLMNQATQIQSDYIEAIKNRNISLTELKFYLIK